MKRLMLTLVLSIGVAICTFAQVGKQFKTLYNTESSEFKNSGWHFSPGLTYTVPFTNGNLAAISAGADTVQTITNDPFGKVSVYLGIGRHHMLDLPFLDMIDYGLAYKRLSMGENVSTSFMRSSDNSSLIEVEEKWNYKRNHVSAYFNATKWFQISDYHFISSGIGFNLDYNVADNRGDHDALIGYGANYPEAFWAQLHYKIGYGIKLDRRFYIIPEIEIPILTAYPTEYGLFSFPALRSQYIPIVFTIKLAFLSKKPLQDCVGKPSKKTGHELWDPKMRRKSN